MSDEKSVKALFTLMNLGLSQRQACTLLQMPRATAYDAVKKVGTLPPLDDSTYVTTISQNAVTEVLRLMARSVPLIKACEQLNVSMASVRRYLEQQGLPTRRPMKPKPVRVERKAYEKAPQPVKADEDWGARSERMKRVWADPDYRGRMSQKTKQVWENPEYRGRIVQGMRKAWEDPNSNLSIKTRERLKSKEHRAKTSAAIIGMWKDPEKAAQLKAHRSQPEVKERHRQAMRDSWADPEIRERRVQSMQNAKARKKAEPIHA